MGLPQHVTLHEVGPRDGLQNEKEVVATRDKVQLIDQLSDAGFRNIEVSSFVSPKWIPGLADASEVFAQIQRQPGVKYSALVPNEQGLERALAAKVDAVNVFMSASEGHNRKNINKSIGDTFPVLEPVIRQAKDAGLRVRGYVSTVFGCPYDGQVPVAQVLYVTQRLLDLGVDEISLGDTIGVAVPAQVSHVVDMLANYVPLERLALHFHDTRGMAIANLYAGLQSGVTVFDASIGGLGGCPYAPGASGNVATDDVLYALHGMGIETGINTEKLGEITRWLENTVLQRWLPSHASQVQRGCAVD